MTAKPPRRIAVSNRAVYHMRQEILRELESVAPDDPPGALRARAHAWRDKYKTMRPVSACALIDRLMEDGREEETLFGLFVLESVSRRFDETVWPRIERWIAELTTERSRDLLARHVAAELLARCPELAGTLAEWHRSQDPVQQRFAREVASALRASDRTERRALADEIEKGG